MSAVALSLTALLAASAPNAPPVAGDARAGEALFLGHTPMMNGGPSCASCHNVAGLPFPYGGSMGPDLTDAYTRLGPDGVRVVLMTMYFPAMRPLFAHRPLTGAEQADLLAYLRAVDRRRPIVTGFAPLAIVGVAGCAALLVITGLYGRGRVRSVRRSLLARVARASKEERS